MWFKEDPHNKKKLSQIAGGIGRLLFLINRWMWLYWKMKERKKLDNVCENKPATSWIFFYVNSLL